MKVPGPGHRAVRFAVFAALAAALVLGVGAVTAQEEPAEQAPPANGEGTGAPLPLSGQDLVRMDFQDVEIPTLVKFISEITGKNFVLDEKITGKISVVSPSKVTVDEAYRVFQSVLQVKGFTLVDAGPVVKIIPIKDAKEIGLPVETGGTAPADTFVTRIVPLEYVAADAAASLLQPLVSREGLISAYAPTNSLIVIDSESNIARLTRIIQQLDIPGQERTVEVIQLHHSYASEMADILREAVEEGRPGAAPKPPSAPSVPGVTSTQRKATTVGEDTGGLKIVPEERANSIVVIGSPFEIRQVQDLVAKLDVPQPRGAGRIRVYPLKYADAVELVQVLADLLGISVSTPLRQAMPGRSVTSGGGRFGSGNRDQPFGQSVMGGQSAGSLGGMRGRQAPSAAGSTSQQQGPAGAGTGGAGVELEGEVRITADPATNSLVIAAAPQDYATLVEVIERLDVSRRQVMVEALLFEISINKAKQLGIELQGGTSVGNGVLFGRTNLHNIDAITNAFASGDTAGLAGVPGLLGALVSNQKIILADGTEIPAGIALVSALATSTDINVLSAPTILTSDNEEAEIVVGQNVPFVTSRATNQTNLENTFSQIDRRDVGITLRLTPQITEGGSVRLFVFQEVSALVPTSEQQVLQLGPTTTLRSATTTVVVGDGETVAIGGLISDRWNINDTGVPYLQDIPVLGQLFRFEDKMKEKVNLIILLTPRVVQNAADLRVASDEQRWNFREATVSRRARLAGTAAGSIIPPRRRSLPASEGGVLLPAVDYSGASGAS